jgi:superfamily II DNA helicase RecQ
MRHFGEHAAYQRCGSCDTCQNHAQFGDDAVRDYTAEASVLFECLRGKVRPLARPPLMTVAST